MENQTNANTENKDNPCDCKYELEKYKITLDFLRFEATTLWQIFNAFFIGHAIFIGFVSTTLVKNKIEEMNFVLLLIAGFVGFLLSLIWLGTFHRNSKWYYFRMNEQAKQAETAFIKCSKNDEWSLLTKEGEKFAKNDSGISNKYGGYAMITIFILIYLFIFLWSFCKLNCNY